MSHGNEEEAQAEGRLRVLTERERHNFYYRMLAERGWQGGARASWWYGEKQRRQTMLRGTCIAIKLLEEQREDALHIAAALRGFAVGDRRLACCR